MASLAYLNLIEMFQVFSWKPLEKHLGYGDAPPYKLYIKIGS
jgi:hypothetical protein